MAEKRDVSNEEAFDACIDIVKQTGFLTLGPIKVNNIRLFSIVVMAMTLLMLHLYEFPAWSTNAAFGLTIMSTVWTIQPTYDQLLKNTMAKLKDELSNIENRKTLKKHKLENFHEY